MSFVRSRIPTGEESPFNIFEDQPRKFRKTQVATQNLEHGVDEGCSSGSDGEGPETSEAPPKPFKAIDSSVADDIARFEDSFKDITKRYRLIDRIGEGTFSTVYKAEDLMYDHYRNDWDLDAQEDSYRSPSQRRRRRPKYVAIKKIYVTSSPIRIQNELELLHDLRSYDSICPLITAFRCQDQVVAVLPYYRHQDFREYFRDMQPCDMQPYFRELFRALAAVHEQGILHRDIKPTNFLYDYYTCRGVLVDFGLAEREGTDSSPCICNDSPIRRRYKIENSYAIRATSPARGYPKDDTRPSRRANRAGTRGFRAPEVLFKCTSQTAKIDIWSAGVILLTIMSRRFPFFNSTDDIDAMIEIATCFGRRKMQNCALLHGTVFDCTIPTIGKEGYAMERLILWSTCRDGEATSEEKLAIRFLERCLELDPRKRISAKEALQHEFFTADFSQGSDEDEMDVLDQQTSKSA